MYIFLAGMAFIQIAEEFEEESKNEPFPFISLISHLTSHLAPYSVPLFYLVTTTPIPTTSTFKHQKATLSFSYFSKEIFSCCSPSLCGVLGKQGYDPSLLLSTYPNSTLHFLPPKTDTVVDLDDEVYENIRSGNMRL